MPVIPAAAAYGTRQVGDRLPFNLVASATPYWLSGSRRIMGFDGGNVHLRARWKAVCGKEQLITISKNISKLTGVTIPTDVGYP